MKVQPKERFRLAWRWLPLELLIIVISGGLGWGLNRWLPKPVYQASVDIRIAQTTHTGMSTARVQRQRRQDIKAIAQFNVIPHQSVVLTAASTYAYVHYGIWQPIQELSESVQAAPVGHRPVLRVTATSSSRQVAQQNAEAFNAAIKDNLTELKHYQVKTVKRTVTYKANVIFEALWKLVIVVGGGLALLSPYLVKYAQDWGRNYDET
ncbi:polysaccharide biosynthesis protein [Lactiplantibacillus paraplantarum]|uniref:polysaccharide biosynthesis protein n=1 Tax=Lactiplantibacillus paraplantarum TaxID=60520 RepID=UPI0022222640|nr:polysaccharide biosynthesis protein [Lactiplantibacillus paraplantarum]MCW1909781.1 polysaccharide biosynthesis protein [Lactiplantibacillus paraplantarum]